MLEQATRRRVFITNHHSFQNFVTICRISGVLGTRSAAGTWGSLRASPGREDALTKRNLIVSAFTLTVLAVAGCGAGGSSVKPTASGSALTPTTSSPTSSQTPTIDPKAQPAVTAYLNFFSARTEALRNPRLSGPSNPLASDFADYSFDPFKGQESASIASLIEQGQLFKGDPGRPRVNVTSIEADAKPYPKVVLKDCPTPAPTWRIYDIKTGSDMTPQLPSGVQPMPYLSTVEVIYYQGHWGVSNIDADTSRTCTA